MIIEPRMEMEIGETHAKKRLIRDEREIGKG
jgi:hypothetical protein